MILRASPPLYAHTRWVVRAWRPVVYAAIALVLIPPAEGAAQRGRLFSPVVRRILRVDAFAPAGVRRTPEDYIRIMERTRSVPDLTSPRYRLYEPPGSNLRIPVGDRYYRAPELVSGGLLGLSNGQVLAGHSHVRAGLEAAQRLPSERGELYGELYVLDRDQFRVIQGYLKERGLYSGGLDGILGPKSSKALDQMTSPNLDLQQRIGTVQAQIAREVSNFPTEQATVVYAFHTPEGQAAAQVGRRRILFAATETEAERVDKIVAAIRMNESLLLGVSTFPPQRIAVLGDRELMQALRKRLPGGTFALMHQPRKGIRALGTVPNVRTPLDLAVYAPSANPALTDYGLTTEFRDLLSTTAVAVSHEAEQLAAPSILVLSFHKEQRALDVLRSAARAGQFRNKHLVLFSCADRGTETFASELIHRHGVRSVIWFDTPLSPDAVRRVVVRMVNTLEARQFQAPLDLQELVQWSAHRAAAGVSAPFRRRIIEIGQPILQVTVGSELRSVEPPSEGPVASTPGVADTPR